MVEELETAQASRIGAGILVTGEIYASGELEISGHVKGGVRCSSLVLSETGRIDGHIDAEQVRIRGAVHGGISAREVVLEPTASVRGDVAYERLRVESGGTAEGAFKRIDRAEQGALLKPVAKAKGIRKRRGGTKAGTKENGRRGEASALRGKSSAEKTFV